MYFPALIIGRITECSIVFHRGLYFGLLQAMVSVIVFRPEVLCDVLMLSRVLLHVEWRPSTHIPSKKLFEQFCFISKNFFMFLLFGHWSGLFAFLGF